MIACFVVYGTVFTWLCAAIGLRIFLGNRCGPGPRVRYAVSRVRAIDNAIAQYRLDRNECPRTAAALIEGGYADARNFTDPWGTAISFRCGVAEDVVISAGPDRAFDTPDDVRNED